MAKEMGFFPPETEHSGDAATAERPVSVPAHEVLALIESRALPEGTRAYLVAEEIGDPSRRRLSPVEHDCSVLNIQRDLFKHLNSSPFPDAFLEELRTYCEERLTARGSFRSKLAEESRRIDESQASGWRAGALELFREIAEIVSATIDVGYRLQVCPDTVNVLTRAQAFAEELRDMVLRKDCDVYEVMVESLTLISLFRAALSLEETPPAIGMLLKSAIQPLDAASDSGGCLCDVEHPEAGYEVGAAADEGGAPPNLPGEVERSGRDEDVLRLPPELRSQMVGATETAKTGDASRSLLQGAHQAQRARPLSANAVGLLDEAISRLETARFKENDFDQGEGAWIVLLLYGAQTRLETIMDSDAADDERLHDLNCAQAQVFGALSILPTLHPDRNSIVRAWDAMTQLVPIFDVVPG